MKMTPIEAPSLTIGTIVSAVSPAYATERRSSSSNGWLSTSCTVSGTRVRSTWRISGYFVRSIRRLRSF
jgi:hypothetical protein